MASEIRHPGVETYGPYSSTLGCKVAWVQKTCGRESHEALKMHGSGKNWGRDTREEMGSWHPLYHQYLFEVGNISENSVGATL